MPPAETLSWASGAGTSAPHAIELEPAEPCASQSAGPLDCRMVQARLDPAATELGIDGVADVPRLDAGVLGRRDYERQKRRRQSAGEGDHQHLPRRKPAVLVDPQLARSA